MPSTKVSQMPVSGLLSGSELVPIIQASVNKRTTTVNIAQVAMPTPIGGLPFAGGMLYTDGVLNYSDTTIFRPSPGVLTLTTLNSVNVRIDNELSLNALDADRVVFAGNPCFTDFSIYNYALHGLHAESMRFNTGLLNLGGDFLVDGGGRCTARELHASDGFNGTGAFTNFTIVDGIITAAS